MASQIELRDRPSQPGLLPWSDAGGRAWNGGSENGGRRSARSTL